MTVTTSTQVLPAARALTRGIVLTGYLKGGSAGAEKLGVDVASGTLHRARQRGT